MISESSSPKLVRNFSDMLPTKHNWSNMQVFAHGEAEIRFLMPDFATKTDSNKNNVSVIQSVMI